VLRSLSCVDDVIVFDDDTPVSALRTLRPQIFVKGGDYAGAELPETHVMAEWGGLVVTVPYLAGRSTTELVSLMAAGHVG
jgi:D-beta-D-heptose 7-phosphate kinase/D-beta-D-heptose 1-phosphate adenosyltransferase